MASLVLSRPNCGAKRNMAQIAKVPNLSIVQQFLGREERIKRIAVRDQFGTAFLAVDNTKRGCDIVAGFFRLLGSFENRVTRRAHIVHDDNTSPGLPVKALDRTLHAVTLSFFSHNESRYRLAFERTHNPNSRSPP